MIPSNRRVNANPGDPAFYQNPYGLYSKQRQHAMFFWEQYQMWCVTSFKIVDSLLRDRRFVRKLPNQEPTPPAHLQHFYQVEKYSLLNLEGAQHRRIRSLVNQAFISRQIKSLAPQIKRTAESLLEELRPLGQADLLPRYATPLAARIIASMLGVPESDIPKMLDWSHAMVRMYTLRQTLDEEIAANTAADEFSQLLAELIAQRRKKQQSDLLSKLIYADLDGERLSDAELISTAVLLLNAGHEATVHQIGNAVKTILQSGLDPSVIFCSEAQTASTVQEALRFDAPLHLFVRYALEDVELDGIMIYKNQAIALLLGAANHDNKRFHKPEVFDPWRNDAGQVSLGAGVHFCVGAQLARLELEISLPMLFERLPGLYFTSPPRYKDAFHFHGLESLELGWDNCELRWRF